MSEQTESQPLRVINKTTADFEVYLAEAVFGWKFHGWEVVSPEGERLPYVRVNFETPEGEHVYKLPSFCTSITDAWTIVEELRLAKGYHFELTELPESEAKSARNDHYGTYPVWRGMFTNEAGQSTMAWGDSAPSAICWAAHAVLCGVIGRWP